MKRAIATGLVCLFLLFAGASLFADASLFAGKPRLILTGRFDATGAWAKESFTPTQITATRLDLKLNTSLLLSEKWLVHASFHNKSYMGNVLNDYQGFTFLRFNRFDWLNLHKTWKDDQTALFYTRFDQAYLDYMSDRFSLRVGRQIINWGHTLVWSVNDIFNSYSLLDITQPVKQGSDAVRLSFYPGPLAAIEVAAKLNYYNKLTTAAMTRFNYRGMDWQFQTGIVDSDHWMFGSALTGKLGEVILRSEGAIYLPAFKKQAYKNILLFAVGADYILANQIIVQAEMLYNQSYHHWNAGFFSKLYRSVSSPLALSPSRWSYSLNASYLLTPRLSLWMFTTYLTDSNVVILAPTLRWKLSANSQLSANYQFSAIDYRQQRYNLKGLILQLTLSF